MRSRLVPHRGVAELIMWLTFTMCIGFGCRSSLSFPDRPLPCAKWPGVLAAYDTNRDGKADFFTFADAAGRIDRIGYDLSGLERPDQIVNLDAIPFARCRHLVLILDGFGYDVLEKYYEQGGLRFFCPPSRVVAPYPSVTELGITSLLGTGPCPGVQSRYFDRKANGIAGGVMFYLDRRNEPYRNDLDFQEEKRWVGTSFVWPRAMVSKELSDLKRYFDARDRREIVAYLATTAATGTVEGEAGQIACLRSVEQLINEIMWETHGLTKVTLLADHGHSYVPPRKLDLAAYLRGKGWRRVSSLKTPNDFCLIDLGLMTAACFSTQRPAALATDVVSCEGVELASYADGEAVVVLSHDGGAARIREKRGRYDYERISGDPLSLAGILARLTPDAEGYYDADDLLAATAAHTYPASLERLWSAHFSLVENPPDVIASLQDQFCSGPSTWIHLLNVESTHGSLNRKNSVAFAMSTMGPLPPVMRSSDVAAQIGALIQASRFVGKGRLPDKPK